MIISVHPQNPQKRTLDEVASRIKKGELFIVPTDTVYAFACAMDMKKTIEKIYFIKRMSENKAISVFCKDISAMSEFIRMDNNSLFRWMKAHLPGPYTLIFKASKNMPNFAITKQKTVGIRVISNPVINGLLERLDVPLVGSSVFSKDEYLTYPEDLDRKFGKQVDGIIDTGPVENKFSTVVDMTDFPPQIIRPGLGDTSNLL
jgi:tRNA threonylcarbamoyl adenosine modification protein (Sua5/YciO/YrdC/YwlC family)